MTAPQDPFAAPPTGSPSGSAAPYGGPSQAEQPPGAGAPYGSGQPGAGPQPGPGQYGAPGSYGPPPTWGAAPQPWGAQPPAGWTGAPRTETKAMVALGLSIAAWTPVIPFLGAIAALVLARMARRDIEASGGALEGLGLCTWATVLSVVHLVLVGLFFVVVLGLFVVPFGLSL